MPVFVSRILFIGKLSFYTQLGMASMTTKGGLQRRQQRQTLVAPLFPSSCFRLRQSHHCYNVATNVATCADDSGK